MRTLKIILLIAIIGFYFFLGIKAISTWPDALTKGQNHRTDRFMPLFDYLSDISTGKTKAEHLQLVRFIEYYQYLAMQNPHDNDLQEILAFCYFYDGKNNMALKSYLQSTLNNPDYFWNFYNLGMLYLSRNDIPRAKSCFEKALSLKPQDSLKHIFSYRVYLQIIFFNHLNNQDMTDSLKDGYQKATEYLQYLNASGNPKEIPVHPKLF